MKCDVCHKPCKRVWQIPGGLFACIYCVPASAFVGYPAWHKQAAQLKRDESTRVQRQKQAQINFSHKEARR